MKSILDDAWPLISLFDLQTQSGQLWPAIKAYLDAKDAAITAITTERDVLKKKIGDFLAADDKTKAKILEDAKKSAQQLAVEAAQAEVAAAQEKLDALK